MATYHLNVKTGSRGGGQSAKAKDDYIEREGKYAKDAEELEHRESGNMPSWARADPGKYWSAADEHERANGRLFVQVEFALPRELNAADRVELAASFAERLTGAERLPYTLAIHRGGGDNPHVHLMISERGLDGHDRDAETWFKRYNAKAPEKGGAKKTSSISLKSNEWVTRTREAWTQEANRALERAGSAERIDHRSLAAQRQEAIERGQMDRAAEFDRTPGVHLGSERYRAQRGGESRVVELARHIKQSNPLAVEIAGVEARLKEIYDRTRAAIDERINQFRRAVREGSNATVWTSRGLGRAGATLGRSIRAGAERVRQVGRHHEHARSGSGKDGSPYHEIDQRLRHSYQRSGRVLSLIHAEAEKKRQDGNRWDRVQGRIESLIQDRVRSRGRDIGPSR